MFITNVSNNGGALYLENIIKLQLESSNFF